MAPSVIRIPGFVSDYAMLVEAEMRIVVSTSDPFLESLYAMLHYHLGWTSRQISGSLGRGKRIRPVLCLLACEAAGGKPQVAVPAAASIELLHNFSLIHDDIEDRSSVRRGQETLWRAWGVPLAINAGDALLILAYEAIHRLRERGLSAAAVEKASSVLHSAGRALFEGQHLDLARPDGGSPSVAQYLAMAERKTAAILQAACHLGAIAAGADKRTRGVLRGFGCDLGLAYQVTDDVLGIWGDPGQTGKPVGEDLLRAKHTLPVAFGLEEERRRGEETLSDLLNQPSGQVDLVATMKRLEDLGALAYARRQADSYLKSALGRLKDKRLDRRAVARLTELSGYIVRRQA